MSNFTFGRTSLARLKGVDPLLAACCKRAIARSTFDFTVIEGRRTTARQAELYEQGRSKPGKIVTWTLFSKHLNGTAVDLGPLDAKGQVAWNNRDAFKELAALMFAAADDLNIKIRWGCDWNMNGIPDERGEYDGPHFELVD